jgi:signal transduction histidine kinase
MESDDRVGTARTRDRTARTVGQVVKYSREVNQSETVDQVASLAIEAAVHVMQGRPRPAVVELAQGEQRVLESMTPALEPGEGSSPLVKSAIDTGRPVLATTENVECRGLDSAKLVKQDDAEIHGDAAVTIAAPSISPIEGGEAGIVLVLQWESLETLAPYHLKPVQYLADHVATAVLNIRSRERLERARADLATRKEMIELYDSLLRHDIGNDLQVIVGFTDQLVALLDDPQAVEYATTIQESAESATDLIDRIGDLVSTLEQEREPEPRSLRPIVETVVDEADAKFDALTVEYDPAGFDCEVFAGDLLDSVFSNLLSNAVVHNDRPVTVEVYADRPDSESVVVGFADDGVGIPPERRETILDMGTKGPDSDGTGLGLGFVRALSESYGGTVRVGESPAGGADFQVVLERAR